MCRSLSLHQPSQERTPSTASSVRSVKEDSQLIVNASQPSQLVLQAHQDLPDHPAKKEAQANPAATDNQEAQESKPHLAQSKTPRAKSAQPAPQVNQAHPAQPVKLEEMDSQDRPVKEVAQDPPAHPVQPDQPVAQDNQVAMDSQEAQERAAKDRAADPDPRDLPAQPETPVAQDNQEAMDSQVAQDKPAQLVSPVSQVNPVEMVTQDNPVEPEPQAQTPPIAHAHQEPPCSSVVSHKSKWRWEGTQSSFYNYVSFSTFESICVGLHWICVSFVLGRSNFASKQL